jgi:hypothetical protein
LKPENTSFFDLASIFNFSKLNYCHQDGRPAVAGGRIRSGSAQQETETSLTRTCYALCLSFYQ